MNKRLNIYEKVKLLEHCVNSGAKLVQRAE